MRYATVIGQVVSLVVAMNLHYRKNVEVKAGFQYLRLQKSVVKEIYAIGLPAIIMQALMSFMTYGINIIFGTVSVAAVTSYGIFYKIQQFICFAAFGLRDAITPIVSFNYGMGNKKRMKAGMKYGILYIEIVMLVGILLLQLCTDPLISVFGLSAETTRLCTLAIRIISSGFLFMGANIAIQGIFQAVESGMGSLIISLLRLLVIPLPVAFVFTKMSDADVWIWLTFPIAELLAFAVAVILYVRIRKQL